MSMGSDNVTLYL